MASWNDDKPISDIRNIKPLTWAVLVAVDAVLWWLIINALQGVWRLVFGG